jgi:hypothetical protein
MHAFQNQVFDMRQYGFGFQWVGCLSTSIPPNGGILHPTEAALACLRVGHSWVSAPVSDIVSLCVLSFMFFFLLWIHLYSCDIVFVDTESCLSGFT